MFASDTTSCPVLLQVAVRSSLKWFTIATKIVRYTSVFSELPENKPDNFQVKKKKGQPQAYLHGMQWHLRITQIF